MDMMSLPGSMRLAVRTRSSISITQVVQPTTVEVGKDTGGGPIVSEGHIENPGNTDVIVGVGCIPRGITTGTGCSIGIVGGGDFTVIARVWIQV